MEDPHVKAIYDVPKFHDCHCEKTIGSLVCMFLEPDGEGYAHKSSTTIAGSWKFTIPAIICKRLDSDSVLLTVE